MKSGGSGTSTATRSPGATPALRSPWASSATRRASAANESAGPPPTATAVASSSSRATSAAHRAAGSEGVAAARGVRFGESNRVIHVSANAATSSSSMTRCPASGKRCSSACGSRRRRSAAKSRWNTGSRSPQTRRTGTSSSGRRAATFARAAADGCVEVVGMSATKSSIALLSSRDA